MSRFNSTIVWKFNTFVPNTVWAQQKTARGEQISEIDVENQITALQTQLLLSYLRTAEPFSLIDSVHNFDIIDNRKAHPTNGRIKFSHDEVKRVDESRKEELDLSHLSYSFSSATSIDKISHFLDSNWAACDEVLENLNNDILSQKLKAYLQSKTDQVKAYLLGNIPTSDHKQSAFFAIKYYDTYPQLANQIKNDVKWFMAQEYQLSKFIIFNAQGKFYELELNISFLKEKEKYKIAQERYKFKDRLDRETASDPRKIKIYLTISDPNGFFKEAIPANNAQPFKKFTFTANGDYIEYPFKESLARKRKFMRQSSYSLVFQGGGAKGVAYVGSYQAIKEMKKEGKNVPITSIMGSSAGGIIALAVSTGIEPYEVQKICYKMGVIPSTDRIDRKYLQSLPQYQTDEKINTARDAMIAKIGKVLVEFGILQKQAIDGLAKVYKNLDQKRLQEFERRLLDFLVTKQESLGQIVDYQFGNFRQLNLLGILLQGALMRGQAIHDIGSQCLVKYILTKDNQFASQEYKTLLGSSLSQRLARCVIQFDKLCQGNLAISTKSFNSEPGIRVLFTIINKLLMVINRTFSRFFRDSVDFILDQNFAKTLLKNFNFKEIYGGEPLTKVEGVELLSMIIFNHQKLHPNSHFLGQTDISQKKERITIIAGILQKDRKITYSTLCQILNQQYFLDPKNYSLNKDYAPNLISLITQLFGHQFKQCSKELSLFNDKIFIRDFSEFITETLVESGLENEFESVTDYKTHFNTFKATVQEITLLQYYKLTGIELTCTSVDLENRILRFFNQKTTPNLPVCRAVQMTGSFPVGFQAQKWRKQWGNYQIHYQQHRRQVFLEGHEFTDGGMLANFPIKYFDNDHIRDLYFSHVINKSQEHGVKHPYQTIMLGFGLDMIGKDQYTPNQAEIYRADVKEAEVQKKKILMLQALKDLISISDSMLNMPKLAWKYSDLVQALRYPTKDSIECKRLNFNLFAEVPLFKFVTKLLAAYPRADRNFNLECFQGDVIVTDLLQKQAPHNEKISIIKADLCEFIESRNDPFDTKSTWGKFKDWWKTSPTYKEDPSSLQNAISQSINSAPLVKHFIQKIDGINSFFTQYASKLQANIPLATAIQLKQTIKGLLLKIIANRMKLEFTRTQIEWHTLEFLSLRYSKQINPDLNKLSTHKFEYQCMRKEYDDVEKELPFELFKKKMYQAEIINGQVRPSDEQLQAKYDQLVQKQRRQIIQEKKKYIQTNLNQSDKKEYLNIQTFLLTNNQKYLIHYILLTKLKPEHLPHANQELKKVSVKTLVNYFEPNEAGDKYFAYITIKDLKAFYRRMFSNDKQVIGEYKYDPETFLQEEDPRAYESEQLKGLKVQEGDTPLPNNYFSSSYINRDVKVNIIHSENLQLKKSFIYKVEFDSILREAFSNTTVIERIEDELQLLIRSTPQKYITELSKILYSDQDKRVKGPLFIQLLENKDARKKLIELLFNRNNTFYDQCEYVSSKYQQQYIKLKVKKEEMIKHINAKITKQLKEGENDEKVLRNGNSLETQVYYLLQLLQQINFRLLSANLERAKDVDYYGKDADFGVGMGKETDRNQRLAIRDALNNQQRKRAEDCSLMLTKLKTYESNIQSLQLFLTELRFGFYAFCISQPKQNHSLKIFKQMLQVGHNIGINFIGIRQWLLQQFNQIICHPIGSITLTEIQEIYSLEYTSFKNLCRDLFGLMKKIQELTVFQEKVKELKILPQDYTQQEKQFAKLKNTELLNDYVVYSFNYFDLYEFQLPNFEVVWSLYFKQFKRKFYSKAWESCLNKQFGASFINKWKRFYPQESNGKQLRLHLILEGKDLSNFYYAYFYELFQHFQEDLSLNKQQSNPIPHEIKSSAQLMKIRAVTTSSYHSIFGFLLSLGYSTCLLKNQMTRIRQIAHQLQPQSFIQGYFDSYAWAYASPQDYHAHWQYIKQEKYNIFLELEKIANKSLENYQLGHQFKEARMMFEHQEERIIKHCEDMLDEISGDIEEIDGRIVPRFKAREISKKYGFNYTCSLNKQHQYRTTNQSTLVLYKTVIQKLFDSYGSLLQGIVTNFCTASIKTKLPDNKSSIICKGFIVKQILTTYKIKEYVMDRLKENSLKENITLSEFFNRAPVKILLNFTTINVHEARLEFMNKNTMPNMPVWAAIVSSSCLPYFYRDFQCPRQFQNPTSNEASLYEQIVNDFFKSNKLDYKKARYCSGNMISSIPFELLTNETTLSKMFTFDKEGQPYLHIGYAFDSNEDDYKNKGFVLRRNYIQTGFTELAKIYWKKPADEKYNKNCTKDVDKHRNKSYQATSGLVSKLLDLTKLGDFGRVMGILVNSNDNFILHSYWDRLVKLPIKIGTLDFHQITNGFLKKTYGADVPSDKTKDTIQRSYEITKYFQREIFGNEQSRYEIKLRVLLFTKEAKVYGEENFFAKIYILSHSKWNRNRYNNFVVAYSTNANNFNATAENASESEIIWNINQSSRMNLRFYVAKPFGENHYQSIYYTQFELDISAIINELPLKNSYDYTFNFYQPVPKSQGGLTYANLQDLPPNSKNNIAIGPEQGPKLKIRTWSNGAALAFYMHPYLG